MDKNGTAESLNHQDKKKLVLLISVILTFTVMNGTMFNVAIPDIAEEFQLLPSQVSWVMTGYILVFAIGSMIYGKLADLFAIKTLLTIGLLLFASGAFLGLLSPNYGFLLAARILQAMGGATIPALAFIIPARFMPDERGKVFGIVSSTVAFASGLGPIMGGLIGGAFNWRYLFVLSILSLIAIPFLRKWLPNETRKKGSVDLPGALFIAIAVAGLLFFVTSFSITGIVVGFVSFLLFIWRIKTYHAPFIDPSMLKDRYYTTTIATSFFGTSAMFGMIFIVPIMARSVYDLSTIQIGFLLFPGAMAAGLIGRFGGKLIDRNGSYPILRAAFVIVMVGSTLISTFMGVPPVLIALCILVQYIAFPLIQSSTANLLTELVPPERTGVGIGLFNLMNFLSGAISSAIFAAFLDLENVNFRMNPFTVHPEFSIYSNLFAGLFILALIALSLFTIVFRNRKLSANLEKL